MDVRVVAVGQLDQPFVADRRVLQGVLARQVQQPFQVPDLAGVGHRLGHVPVGRDPAQLVREEQHGHQRYLAQRPAHLGPAGRHRPPAGLPDPVARGR
jgi:hypothetical protein